MGDSLGAMAATYRAARAQKYLSSQTAQAVLGIDSTMLTAWRKERRLLAVWHRPANDWLYPDFQFEDGSLIKEVPDLLAVYESYYSHVWSNTWSIVEWYMSPHLLLDGARPAEVLAKDPQKVIAVARAEFLQDPATMW